MSPAPRGRSAGFALALARVAGLHGTGIAGAGDREFVESQGAAFVPRSDGSIAVAPGGFDAVVDLAVIGPSLMELIRDGGVGAVPLRVAGVYSFADAAAWSASANTATPSYHAEDSAVLGVENGSRRSCVDVVESGR